MDKDWKLERLNNDIVHLEEHLEYCKNFKADDNTTGEQLGWVKQAERLLKNKKDELERYKGVKNDG